ncbi:hypothetical protein FOCC_FOCC017208, partial [Frankliniella occidentalis]|uniref:Unconventional myosin-IXb-like n=1 Tax=Frankliniella occidentalis TaxID=133901 RepID=A0A9C6XAA7_FRAOC
MGTLGLSKVFILDKYFTELQKFWETEKKLQDASSSNEAVHLQQRLRSLSTELVTLRNRLHVQGGAAGGQGPQGPPGGQGQGHGQGLGPHHGGQNQAPPVAPKPMPSPEKGVGILHPGHIIHQPLPPTPLQLQQQHAPPPPPPPPSAPPPQSPLPQQLTPTPPHTPKQASAKHKDMQSPHLVAGRHTPGELSRPPSQAQLQTPSQYADLHDLIHLPGPLTEDAVLKCLHGRFAANQLHTNVGPILLSMNAYHDVGNPLTLSSTREVPLAPQLLRVVQDAVRQQAETGYPQAMILSGCSGSGKTYAAMLLLRQLFDVAGGGPETDAFKHLAAAFTVLRALGSAKTASNSESSRIGHFIEVQVTDGALYRTKIHCYFLDQTRVIRPAHNERNYHIFYQMLAGLTPEER